MFVYCIFDSGDDLKEMPELGMLDDEDFEGEAAEDQMECTIVPAAMLEPDGEDPASLDADLSDSWFSDEEVLEYQVTSKGASPPREDAVYSSEAASSSGRWPKGHFATPDDIRRMIPPGSKIQHRRAKSESHCSGWQAWPELQQASRFFSYGKNGNYNDRENALEAAVAFCWASKPK